MKFIKKCSFLLSHKTVWIITLLLFQIGSEAQCAMCRASLEGDTNIEKAKAVNNGIVYLMIIPYILAAGIAFRVYKMYQSQKK